MNLSDFSIRNPVFAWMLMAAFIIFGWFCFKGLGISLLPDVDFPTVTATITLEGAAPEVMETQVADVVEEAVMSIQGIRKVSSSSRQGSSSINIEFELNRDIDVAMQDVQTHISQAQRNLPTNIDPPVITKANPEDQPIMWVAISGDVPMKDIMTYVHDSLKDQFSVVPGVGDIILGGYVDPNLRVWIDQDKLQNQQLAVTDVIAAIQSEHKESPAGYIENKTQELNVRVMGEADTVEQFSKILIPTRGGQPVWQKITIGDVGQVEEGLNDVRRISRHMGVMGAGLGIKKLRGENAVEVANKVKEKIAILQKTLPPQYHMEVVFDGTKFIEESTSELIFTLILSALLTGFVCWFFLGSMSSTINVLLAIPTSIVGSFIFLYFFGFTLNTFTLLGLALAIGIVVDDAIMVLENIVRYNEQGKSRVLAAILGAREITSAAVAASFAILAIFVPVIFMKGIVGKFLYQFGVTMSIAVLISLLEALTLAPMRCSQYLKAHATNRFSKAVDAAMNRLKNGYQRSLRWCLNYRWLVVAASLILFVGSLQLNRWIGKEFVPAQDQSRFLVRVQTPIGSSLEVTDSVMKQAEQIMTTLPGIDQYYVAVGGFGGGEVDSANMFVTLKEPKDRPFAEGTSKRLTQTDIMNLVRDKFSKIPNAFRVIVQDLSLSAFGSNRGFPVEFTIFGADWEKLGEYSQQIMDKMKSSGLMQDIDSDYKLGAPEVRVIPDRDKANARGVSVADMADTINAMIGGVRVGKYTKNGKRYDIRLRLTDSQRKAVDDVDNIWVRNRFGELVKLSDVVTTTQKPALQSITRINRERAISVFSSVKPGTTQADALAEVKKIADEVLPKDYRIEFSGSAETFKESFQSLLIAMGLGLLVAYMILASQYNSFIHPIVVLMALPFSITGAFLGLLIGGQTLNLYSMIGMVLLMGIVKKNSILLVDFTNEKRKHGMDAKAAILDACPLRLRPILMTSFATIAGALPAALGIGPGAETRIPMAMVVIGGVLVSTFLTLFVVPCVYSLFTRLESHKHEKALQEALALSDK